MTMLVLVYRHIEDVLSSLKSTVVDVVDVDDDEDEDVFGFLIGRQLVPCLKRLLGNVVHAL